MTAKTIFYTLLFLSLTCAFCTEEELEAADAGDYAPEKLTALMPLQTGKYITYRLDSIVTIRQGRGLETHSYQIKDVIDSLIGDNLSKPSYRVYRFISDSLGQTPWQPHSTYYITPYTEKIETVESNLRTINLHLPLRIGASWKGSRYLPSGAYGFFNDARFTDVYDWDFSYQSVGTETIGNRTLDSVWTVLQFNNVFDTLSVANPHNRLYGIGYSEEKYAKGIGLVAKQLLMIENNPNQLDSTTYDPYKTGFGIRMWMVDHN